MRTPFRNSEHPERRYRMRKSTETFHDIEHVLGIEPPTTGRKRLRWIAVAGLVLATRPAKANEI